MSRIVNKTMSKVFQLGFLKKHWAKKYQSLHFDKTPWAPLKSPLKNAKVAFISTAGIHLKEDQPFDMSDKDGDITFRSFSADVDPAELKITHDYYNHSDADRDINVVLPLQALRDCREEGLIGSFSNNFYSFMGHIQGRLISKFIKKSRFELSQQLVEEKIDVAIVSPA